MDDYVLGNMECSRVLVELHNEGKLSDRDFYKIRRLVHKFYYALKSIDNIPDDAVRDRVIVMYRDDKLLELSKITTCSPFAISLTRSVIRAIAKNHITESRRLRTNPGYKFYNKNLEKQ